MRAILRAVVGLSLIALPTLSFARSTTTGPEAIPTILQQVRIGDGRLVPNTGMSPPIALVHPASGFTIEALQAGVEGTVTVRAEFDIDGHFQVLGIVDGLGYGLDEAALAALREWTFRPAYRSGRRVAVVANIDVEFRNPTLTEAYKLAVQRIQLEIENLAARQRALSDAKAPLR